MNNRLRNCCEPLINENKRIDGLKPMIIISLLLIVGIVFLDYFIFETTIYIYLSLIVLPIFIMILKRFYYIYTIYSIVFIFLVLPKIINDLGTYFQVETITTTRIVIFCLKCFCLILLFMIYFIFFQYYKELKFIYIQENQIYTNNLLNENTHNTDFDNQE